MAAGKRIASSSATTHSLPLMTRPQALILFSQVRFVRFNDRFEAVLKNAPILLGQRGDDHFLRSNCRREQPFKCLQSMSCNGEMDRPLVVRGIRLADQV